VGYHSENPLNTDNSMFNNGYNLTAFPYVPIFPASMPYSHLNRAIFGQYNIDIKEAR
jgi:hypothetical protein